MRIELIAPDPPRLSLLVDELRAIEASGVYSNNGPVLRRFEAEATARLFGGRGDTLGVANATVGLTAALLAQTGGQRGGYALMPAFTFAATAHAAIAAGLTPLLCDIDADRWQADPDHEAHLLARHGGEVRAIVPYATFGSALDLDRYARLARDHRTALAIDAAASLGTRDSEGLNFGAGFGYPVVFSMHATKAFATGEGGLIHSGDRELVRRLRAIVNFGFEAGRSATLPGLNGKLCEIQALLALAKLHAFDPVVAHRHALAERYRAELADFQLQAATASRQSMQFASVLLPAPIAGRRDRLIAALAAEGIGAGTYFSPHLAQQPWLQGACSFGALPVSDDVGSRIVALPITDGMVLDEVGEVARAFRRLAHEAAGAPPRARSQRQAAA